ncbi:MAG: cation-efflux pump [Planctomycetota bacterium]
MPDSGLTLISEEKSRVALTSLAAAFVLTGAKLVVGLATGSLGVLSEAAHSGLDLFAAGLTFFAVRASDKPADADHRYGHGKVENLSAFIETLLLVVACVWIVKEAVERIFFKHVQVEATFWAFAVIAGSIAIDVSRSRALRRAARKYRSQALEADALHFSTDVWSSAVVLLGLALVKVGELTGRSAAFSRADAVAAICVACTVAFVSFRLGKRTVDALLDRAPEGLAARIEREARAVDGVLGCENVRLREVGRKTFVDLEIDVDRTASFEKSHDVCVAVEESIRSFLPEADVVVHVNPARSEHESLIDRVRTIAAAHGRAVHNLVLYDAGGELGLDLHMEVDRDLELGRAHELAEELETAIRKEMPLVKTVTTRIEPRDVGETAAEDVTEESKKIVDVVRRIACETPRVAECHEVTIRRAGRALALSLHCLFDPGLPVGEVHRASAELEGRVRKAFPRLSRVTIHAEPREDPSAPPRAS